MVFHGCLQSSLGRTLHLCFQVQLSNIRKEIWTGTSLCLNWVLKGPWVQPPGKNLLPGLLKLMSVQ